jgi:hypothetical protein
MSGHKHQIPRFLEGIIAPEAYRRWLYRKAAAHVKRDRKRVPDALTGSRYRDQIHAAVCESGGLDWYTGEKLAWQLISTYDNEASKLGRSDYKKKFALLPTVDHVKTNSGYEFIICGWRTNDAKNDLDLNEFLSVCRMVIAKHGS